MANEFDKRYDELVEEMKASIKELLCYKNYNAISASDDYWNVLHVVEEGAHESLDIIAHTYYVVDDMIMASEHYSIDDVQLSDLMNNPKYHGKSEDELSEIWDEMREVTKPHRTEVEYCESDIELTSYEHLTLAYENIKGVIDNYIK